MDGFLDPVLGPTDVGSEVCLVLKWDGQAADGTFEGVGVSRGQRLSFQESIMVTPGKLATIYFWRVEALHDDGSVHLCRTSRSSVHEHEPMKLGGAVPAIVSTCSGMGGIIMGAHRAGFETLVAIDHSSKAKEMLTQNFSFPVLEGEIGDLRVIQKTHALVGSRHCILEGGFPCQPYSSLGDQKGFGDQRAFTLVELLRGGWLLQVRGVVLECVAGAGRDPHVRALLQAFNEALGFKKAEKVLRLDVFWPTRRTRWWAILYPQECPTFDLPEMPDSSFTTIEKVIPSWPVFPLVDELALKWNDEEESIFRDARFGSTDRTVPLTGKFPTILHSCGCHFRGCPCGCRSHAFHPDRLLQGGLHCPEIKSMQKPSFPRYPHPEELGLLHGVDSNYVYGNLKDSLCMLGQIAAPWQSEWCFLHLRAVFLTHDDVVSVSEYAKTVMLYDAHDLVVQTQSKWMHARNGAEQLITVTVPHEPPYSVKLQKRARIEELLDAHANVAKSGPCAAIHQTCELPTNHFVPGDVIVREGIPPVNDVTVQIDFVHEDEHRFVSGPAGSYLFDLALQVGVAHENWVFLEVDGTTLNPLGPDHVLYTSKQIRVRPLIFGSGSRPHLILEKVINDTQVYQWQLDRRLDGHVSPGFDRGLDDVTIDYAARALLRLSGQNDVRLVSPIDVHGWLCRSDDEARDKVAENIGIDAPHRILALLGVDGHWALIDYQVHAEGGSESTYIDGMNGRLTEPAKEVGSLIHEFISDGPLQHVQASCYAQAPDTTCGAVMLLHLGWRLGLWSFFSSNDVEEWYRILRWGPLRPTLFGGGSDDSPDAALESTLSTYLRKKGVPDHALSDRIQEACRALGKSKIVEALKARNPWQSLKSLGNNRSRPFLWVRYDELRAHIDQKGKDKWGANVDIPRKKDFKKINPERRIEDVLQPGSLTLTKGIFTDGTNDVGQIDFSAVKSGAVGVAFCRAGDALPYVANPKSISVGPLMLLILGNDQQLGSLQNVMVPATYRGTDEPVILSCSMLQLGDVNVQERNVAAPEIGTLPTKVIRLQVYRDEWAGAWAEFPKHPVKSLVTTIEALQLCRDPGCSQCGKYHAAVEENGVESALVDVWGWRWTGSDGRKAISSEAISFSFFVRIPESGFASLNEGLDVAGVYVEPRMPQGQGTDAAFSVIWLAQSSGQHVRHLAKTDDKIVGVARLADRFGVRVKAAHAEEIHRKLCPNKPFMNGAVSQIYRVEPLPPGTHRQGLADALKSFGWETKPMQAAKGSQGKAWEVGSKAAPPQTILKLATGYVTITKIRDTQQQKPDEAFIGSQRTRRHIRADPEPSSSSTPWGKDGDPWARFLQNKSSSGAAPSTGPEPVVNEVKTKIAEVRESILEEVTDALKQDLAKYVPASPDVDMSATSSDPRFDLFENEIHTLKEQGQRFEQWFAAVEDKASAQTAQLTRVEAQLEQQSEFTTRLAGTVEGCTRTLAGQQDMMQALTAEVHGVKNQVESSLDKYFARQTAQIENMLNKEGEARKKARQEGQNL